MVRSSRNCKINIHITCGTPLIRKKIRTLPAFLNIFGLVDNGMEAYEACRDALSSIAEYARHFNSAPRSSQDSYILRARLGKCISNTTVEGVTSVDFESGVSDDFFYTVLSACLDYQEWCGINPMHESEDYYFKWGEFIVHGKNDVDLYTSQTKVTHSVRNRYGRWLFHTRYNGTCPDDLVQLGHVGRSGACTGGAGVNFGDSAECKECRHNGQRKNLYDMAIDLYSDRQFFVPTSVKSTPTCQVVIRQHHTFYYAPKKERDGVAAIAIHFNNEWCGTTRSEAERRQMTGMPGRKHISIEYINPTIINSNPAYCTVSLMDKLIDYFMQYALCKQSYVHLHRHHITLHPNILSFPPELETTRLINCSINFLLIDYESEPLLQTPIDDDGDGDKNDGAGV